MLIPVLRTLASKVWLHRGELLAIVALVAVTGEVYLRLPVGRQLEYQPDKELVGILAPGQRSARETVNRDGHRGKDTDWSAPVILAVGDSQGWGAGVADDEVWTARLEQRLKRGRAYAAFQVVNASHPGHGPYHHYLRARRVLEKHRVDLLIVRVSLEDWNFRPTPPQQVSELIEAARFRQSVRQYTKFLPFLANRAQEQLVSIRATLSSRTSGAPTLDRGRRMCAEHGQWWDRLADLAEEHEVPVVFFLYDPTDLPGSEALHARLRDIANGHRDVHLFRMGSQAFGLRGGTPEAINREFRARFTLPHDPHANALQHALIGREVHSFLAASGLLADASARRRTLHAKR
jgi:hypothetical protein